MNHLSGSHIPLSAHGRLRCLFYLRNYLHFLCLNLISWLGFFIRDSCVRPILLTCTPVRHARQGPLCLACTVPDAPPPILLLPRAILLLRRVFPTLPETSPRNCSSPDGSHSSSHCRDSLSSIKEDVDSKFLFVDLHFKRRKLTVSKAVLCRHPYRPPEIHIFPSSYTRHRSLAFEP